MYFIRAYQRRFLFSSVLSITLLFGGCSSVKSLESSTPAGPITIDAEIGDWNNSIRKLDSETVSMGVLNDDDHLYVALYVADQHTTGQIMRSGFILWLDPEGGKEKSLGIHFPLGMAALGPRGGRSANVTGAAPGNPSLTPESTSQRFTDQNGEIEILTHDAPGMRFQVDSVPGIDVKASVEYGTLVYELKIPLQNNGEFPYAVDAEPGAEIGVGLETPEMGRQTNGQGPASGGIRGGGGGRGGRGGGGGGGRPGGGLGGVQTDPPLDIWTSVTLAK